MLYSFYFINTCLFDEVKSILDKEKLPYNSINEDTPFIPFTGRKVYYNILLDDRAGLNQTYNELLRLYNKVITNLE